MDTVVTRKNRKNKYLFVGIPAFLALGFVGYNLAAKKKTLNVSVNEISIKTVEKAYFEDFIVFQATAEPLHSTLLNVVEGGSIQEIFAANGDLVSQGQPLARLYNPNSELNYMTQETSIIEQINNMNKARLDLSNQELSMSKDLIAIEHDFLDAKNLFELNEKLFKQEILSKNEWEKTQENFRFQKERKKIIQQTMQREKEANRLQYAQMAQSLNVMQKSLEILRSNKKNFLVTAPMTGRLTSFEPVLGKNYTAGESIGKIDVMKGYKLVAEIDEYYLQRVSKGQYGKVDYKGKEFDVTVSKVVPEVKKGRFIAELNFVSDKVVNMEQGLSFSVRLMLSEKVKTTVIPRGSFDNVTEGKWIFVVEGTKATRRKIVLGRENPVYNEVLSGLKSGDKVITSNYSDYKDVEVLNID